MKRVCISISGHPYKYYISGDGKVVLEVFVSDEARQHNGCIEKSTGGRVKSLVLVRFPFAGTVGHSDKG